MRQVQDRGLHRSRHYNHLVNNLKNLGNLRFFHISCTGYPDSNSNSGAEHFETQLVNTAFNDRVKRS